MFGLSQRVLSQLGIDRGGVRLTASCGLERTVERGFSWLAISWGGSKDCIGCYYDCTNATSRPLSRSDARRKWGLFQLSTTVMGNDQAVTRDVHRLSDRACLLGARRVRVVEVVEARCKMRRRRQWW